MKWNDSRVWHPLEKRDGISLDLAFFVIGSSEDREIWIWLKLCA